MKVIRKPIAKKPKEQIVVSEKPDEPDNMKSNLSKNDTMKRAIALYCDAYIDRVKIPLIIDSGSTGCIISLKLLKDLDMKITQVLKTIMVNVNAEKRRPLGAVTKIPLKINNHIIPFDAVITEAESYAAIVENDWLKETQAIIDYRKGLLTLLWNNKDINVPVECYQLPHNRILKKINEEEIEDNEQEKHIIDDSDTDEEYEEE